MQIIQPNIVVTSPDEDYLMLVEVTLNGIGELTQNPVEQLKYLMVSYGCSVGLAIAGERIVLLRDSFEKSNGESIYVVGEAKLPDSLLPPADDRGQEERLLEFESRVQQWLERLKLTSSLENLPNDLRKLLGEPIPSLLRLGEVRVSGPRWSKVAK